MLFLFVFVLIVVAVSALAVWPRIGSPPAAARPWRVVDDGSASAEGVLAAQLAAGVITHRQYVRAMEHLAAGDELRAPLVVPPERGTPGT